MTPEIIGIPPEQEVFISTLVGIVAAWLVQPLTTLAKRFGSTQGVTTVMISGALSGVIAFIYTLGQAYVTHQGASLGQVLWIALVAFMKANGDYQTKVNASTKAQQKATDKHMLLESEGSKAHRSTLTESMLMQALREQGVKPTAQHVMRLMSAISRLAPELLTRTQFTTEDYRAVCSIIRNLQNEGKISA